MTGGPLVCPRCATTHPLEESFCPRCGMPLLYGGRSDADAPGGDTRERARKINPVFSDGELVKVAWTRNQAEAELVAGLLLEEGVPSVIKRARGFDVPDFLAAGPRDVLVPESGAPTAREVLGEDPVARAAGPAIAHPWRLAAALLAAVGVAALAAWLGTGAG